jgi:excisionase family DNA binding protein
MDKKKPSDAALRLAGLINITEACEHLGVSRPTIYRWIKDPVMNFPPPVKIGLRAGWRKSDIDHWLKVLSS